MEENIFKLQLEDVRLYCFGCHIEFLRLDDDMLAFMVAMIGLSKFSMKKWFSLAIGIRERTYESD